MAQRSAYCRCGWPAVIYDPARRGPACSGCGLPLNAPATAQAGWRSWRTLAVPTYATSRFGRTVQFPAGTTLRPLAGSKVGSEPFADAIRVVVADGTFECERTTVVRPDGTSPPPTEVPALWWVTASALQFEGEGS